jgi:hypothetical protein
VPLKKSASPEAFKQNLKAELKSGKPQKQALAIAFDVQRRAKKKLARGGIVEGILAKAKPESPLKGIRIRASKPSFLSRAVRPGGMAAGGTVPEEEVTVPKGRFGFPASTKGAGRGEGMAALTEDQPPTVGPKGPPRPPGGFGKAPLTPPPAAAAVAGPPKRRPKVISSLRGGIAQAAPPAFKKGGAVKKFAEGGLVTRGDGLARKGLTKGREI